MESKIQEYMSQALTTNGLLNDPFKETTTFELILLNKQRMVSKVLNIKESIATASKRKDIKNLPSGSYDEGVLFEYMFRSGLVPVVQSIIDGIMYGPKYPNPLSQILFKVEQKSQETFDSLIPEEYLNQQLYNGIDISKSQAYLRERPLKGISFGLTPQMIQNSLPKVLGPSDFINIIALETLGAFRTFISRFDWRKGNPKVPPNFKIKEIYSFSSNQIMNKPGFLVGQRHCELNVFYDLTIAGGLNFSVASQVFLEILVRLAIYIEKDRVSLKEVYPIGFYSSSDALSPFLDIKHVEEFAESASIREKLLQAFTRNRVFLKVIWDQNSVFRMINIYFNMHFITDIGSPNGVQALTHLDSPENYVRVFFDEEDLITWNAMFPSDRGVIKRQIERKMTDCLRVGNLNEIAKLKLLQGTLLGDKEYFHKVAKVLMNGAENMFNLSKMAELLFIVFKIISRTNRATTPSKLQSQPVSAIMAFYKSFKDSLSEFLGKYETVYLEGATVYILSLVESIDKQFADIENTASTSISPAYHREVNFHNVVVKTFKIFETLTGLSDFILLYHGII